MPDEAPISDSVVLEDIVVEEGYSGPRMEGEPQRCTPALESSAAMAPCWRLAAQPATADVPYLAPVIAAEQPTRAAGCG
jgi:hypothetical protein